MESKDVFEILTHILNGGHESVITLLLAIVVYLIWDRKRLLDRADTASNSSIQSKDDEKKIVLSIIDRYHSGNLAMVQALGEIKIVLTTIQERIR